MPSHNTGMPTMPTFSNFTLNVSLSICPIICLFLCHIYPLNVTSISFLVRMGCIKDVFEDFRRFWRLSYIMNELLHAITCYYSTCYDNAIIRFVTFYYITLNLYYYVFVALNNPSSNTHMTDFFMLSYIASLPFFSYFFIFRCFVITIIQKTYLLTVHLFIQTVYCF